MRSAGRTERPGWLSDLIVSRIERSRGTVLALWGLWRAPLGGNGRRNAVRDATCRQEDVDRDRILLGIMLGHNFTRFFAVLVRCGNARGGKGGRCAGTRDGRCRTSWSRRIRRDHELSFQKGCRGACPQCQTARMIIRPPQRGHGHDGLASAETRSALAAGARGLSASSLRHRSSLAAR